MADLQAVSPEQKAVLQQGGIRAVLDWLIDHLYCSRDAEAAALDRLLDPAEELNSKQLLAFLPIAPQQIGRRIQWLSLAELQGEGFLDDLEGARQRLQQDAQLSSADPSVRKLLDWAQQQGFTDQDRITAALSRLLARIQDDEEALLYWRELDPAAVDAMLLRLRWQAGVNQLSQFGYIEPAQRKALIASSEPIPAQAATLAGLLAWLQEQGGISAAACTERTRELCLAQRDTPNLRALEFLAEIAPQGVEEIVQFHELRRHSESRRALLNTVAFFALLVIGGLIYLFWPVRAPSCDDSDTKATLEKMWFTTSVQTSTQRLLQGDKAIPSHSFKDMGELGYDEESDTRACKVTLVMDGEPSPLGFLIHPADKGDGDNYQVQMRPLEYVTVRFGKNAYARDLGQPLGAAALDTAVRDGIQQINESSTALRRLHQDDAEDPVLGVLPTANCSKLAGGLQSCAVLIDYDDALQSLVGGSGLVQLHAKVTLQQSAGQWRVTEHFAEEFAKALLETRMAHLPGKSAAPK
ncbi:hypothetical protein [Chitinolyticbacter albus]|uniref:hypothetical protein n=1 Tax=Chitinolyticbacter albus TaxID=2961951 RepID=UPI002108A1C8|nr:hypothetical protein [Chitinolyticbacter albus]